MGRLISGGRSGGIRNRTYFVAGQGNLYSISRSLGAGSTLSLREGSHANLSLQGGVITASSSLAVGVSQTALIRERMGDGVSARSVEYAVTLTGRAQENTPVSQPEDGTFLPTHAALAGAYGLAKLVLAYTGPALRVRRASDGYEADIGFNGQVLDVSAGQGIQGSSSLTVVVVYDQTGGEKHLIQPNAADQPTLWLGEGGPTVTNYTGDRPMLIPASLAIERANCAIFMVTRTPGQAATCGYWAFGDTSVDYALTSARTVGNQAIQPMISGASISSSDSNPMVIGASNMSIVSLVSNAVKQVVHRDEQTIQYPAASSGVLDRGGEVGEAIGYDGRTDWQAFVVYAAAPSDGDVAAVRTALKTIFETAEPATLSMIAGGDSIIFGTGGSHNRTITAALYHRSSRSVIYRNVGIAGHRLDGHYTDFDTASGAYLTPGVQNVYFANYGHNDIKALVTDSVSGAATVDLMKVQAKHMAAKLRSYGFDIVIWQEAFADKVFTADQEWARDTWNAWLRSGALADDGLPCFDTIDTVASDAAFVLSDAETDAGRGMMLTVNSSDGVHPNEIHAGVRAEHLWAAYAAIPFGIKYVVKAGQQGLSYVGYQPKIVKGVGPFTFTIAPTSVALPSGLTLNSISGVITGIPAVAGVTNDLVLRVTDSLGAVAETTFTLTIAASASIAVMDSVESITATDSLSVPVTLPSIVNAGDVLVAITSADGSVAMTWDNATAGEWTQRAAFISASNAHKLFVMTKTADGSEGGKVLHASFGDPQQSVTRVLCVTGSTGVVEASNYVRNSTVSADPPALTPSWSGAGLTIAVLALDGNATVVSGPDGYSGFTTLASSVSGQSTNATAWKIASGAEDPGPFTLSASGQWVAGTIVLQAA